MQNDLSPPMPDLIEKLPRDEHGLPIPWFAMRATSKLVAGQSGRSDFSCTDPDKLKTAVDERVCWMCGQPAGIYKSFIVSPRGALTRVSGQPPSHLSCADYAVQACPFLTTPGRERSNDPLGLLRDSTFDRTCPEVTIVWEVMHYGVKRVAAGYVFDLRAPSAVFFWRDGRRANRKECMDAINAALGPLMQAIGKETDENIERAGLDLGAAAEQLQRFVPGEMRRPNRREEPSL